MLCSTWNNGLGTSPSWRESTEKLQEEAFKRGGVPVFRRVKVKPRCFKLSDRALTAGRLSPAHSVNSLPIQVTPLRAVPEVIINAFADIIKPDFVLMPVAR